MKKENLKRSLAIGATALLVGNFVGCASKDNVYVKEEKNGDINMTQKQPNILLITTDQQHAKLMSCAGDKYVKTPSLDKLSSQGVRFTKAYSPNPVCVPCRYSWSTGYMPHVFNGMEDNFKRNHDGLPKISEYINTPVMGGIFKNAGYNVALGGKHHVGPEYDYQKHLEKEFIFEYVTNHRDTKPLADACIKYINRKHDKPFLLWTSFDNPHDICHFLRKGVPDNIKMSDLPELPENFKPSKNEIAWIKGFRDGTLGDEEHIELGQNRRFGVKTKEWDERTWRYYRKLYRDYMEDSDKQIGRVLDALESAGLADNTIVIFTSDHGDHDAAHQLTMKRFFYEESVNIPFIIKDPRNKNKGVINEESLINTGLDLIPTMCDYAGFAPPKELKGESIKSIIDGKKSEREFVVSQTVSGRMVRTSQYKYMLLNFDSSSEEMLFDLDNDPLEMNNIAQDEKLKTILLDHRKKLETWAKEYKDSKALIYLEEIKRK